MVEKKIGDKTIRLVKGDITDMEVEAFVYDITEDAKLSSGYGGAITVRGGPEIQKELDAIGSCPQGTAITTSGGNLKAARIVYINGPKFHEPQTEEKLRRAVKVALDKAEEEGLKQLAFPPVGTGLYQVPLELCARVLLETVSKHLQGASKLQEVIFVALDTREYLPLQTSLQQGA